MQEKAKLSTEILTRRCILLSIRILIVLYFHMRSSVNQVNEYSKASRLPEFVPCNHYLGIRNGTFNGQHSTLNRFIRNMILGPSKIGYKLEGMSKRTYSQANQDVTVDKILHGKRGGFFVECGAGEGETFSNSLMFERYRDWDGLLIEANPILYSKLLTKGRKAYSLNACLSLTPVPKAMSFYPAGLLGGLQEGLGDIQKKAVNYAKGNHHEMVQCLPLQDIMEAMERNHIDYLSLDVEGPELEIFQTIPFDKLRIDVMTIEYALWDGKQRKITEGKAKLQEIRDFVFATGLYEEVGILVIPNVPGNVGDLESDGLDIVFKRKDLD